MVSRSCLFALAFGALLFTAVNAQEQVYQGRMDWRPGALERVQIPMLADIESPPVLAIMHHSSRPLVAPENRVERAPVAVAAWADGTVLWTPASPEAPLQRAQVSPERVAAVVAQLEAAGLFADPPRFESGGLIPDSGWSTLWVDDGSRRFAIRSVSDFRRTEAGGTVALTTWGLESLGDRTLEDVLAAQPESFRQFREHWIAAADALMSLVPDAGESVSSDQVHTEWQTLQ